MKIRKQTAKWIRDGKLKLRAIRMAFETGRPIVGYQVYATKNIFGLQSFMRYIWLEDENEFNK